MDHKIRKASTLTDITGMFDADTTELIKGGFVMGLEDILDDMMRDAFVHSVQINDDATPKWTLNERVYIADLVRLLKLVTRILCKVTERDSAAMMDEKDAERLHVQIMEICGGSDRAANLRYLEELMITQLTAPMVISEFYRKEQLDSIVFNYKFLKGIISSYDPGYMERKLAA